MKNIGDLSNSDLRSKLIQIGNQETKDTKINTRKELEALSVFMAEGSFSNKEFKQVQSIYEAAEQVVLAKEQEAAEAAKNAELEKLKKAAEQPKNPENPGSEFTVSVETGDGSKTRDLNIASNDGSNQALERDYKIVNITYKTGNNSRTEDVNILSNEGQGQQAQATGNASQAKDTSRNKQGGDGTLENNIRIDDNQTVIVDQSGNTAGSGADKPGKINKSSDDDKKLEVTDDPRGKGPREIVDGGNKKLIQLDGWDNRMPTVGPPFLSEDEKLKSFTKYVANLLQPHLKGPHSENAQKVIDGLGNCRTKDDVHRLLMQYGFELPVVH